jgi:hypothetical protein
MGLKHDKAGTLEYFAWSDFTLYCYACAESEVKGSNLVPDSHYDVYEVYARPFYDPVAAWAHKPPCYDTPGWHSPDFDTCQAYVERRWCIDGNIEWAEHYGGVAFRSPEKNCCACGGGSAVAPAPSPPPSHNPLPCVDLKLQGMPDAAHHLVLLTVPGQQPAGVVLSAWRDPLSKRCSDYAIKGAAHARPWGGVACARITSSSGVRASTCASAAHSPCACCSAVAAPRLLALPALRCAAPLSAVLVARVAGWCSNGRVLSERVTGIRNHNPEDACCVCGTCKGRAFSLARPQCSRLPLTRF